VGGNKDCHVRNGKRDNARGFSLTAWKQFSKERASGVEPLGYAGSFSVAGRDHGLVILVHEEARELQTALSDVRDLDRASGFIEGVTNHNWFANPRCQ
jgi:hypothetical protein